MDEKEKIKLIQKTYAMFLSLTTENGLDFFSGTKYYENNDKPLFDDHTNFLYLEKKCPITQFTSPNIMRDVFSEKIAEHVENFQKLFYDRLYVEMQNSISKLDESEFKDFMENACKKCSDINELFTFCERSKYADHFEDLLEDTEQFVTEDFARHNTDIIKIKIGILENKLFCIVNTDTPKFDEKYDQIIFESNTILSPENTFQECKKHFENVFLKIQGFKKEEQTMFVQEP